MWPDYYKVEILHYLSPHLIWVEVTDQSVARKGEHSFEQIGVYGILPFETTLDVEDEASRGQRCQNWVPAVMKMMKNVLKEATETYFSPTHIDRRTSIFDDNLHKYGEVIIKMHNKEVKLSEFLVNAGFALYDECIFHQELRGNLKTRLNNEQTKQVIFQIDQYFKKNMHRKKDSERLLKKQTVVYRTAQELFQNETVNSEEFEKILEKKLIDLAQCKDVDEESMGRASRLQRKTISNPQSDSSLLNVKLKLHQQREKKAKADESPLGMLMALKQNLASCARTREDVKEVRLPDSKQNTEVKFRHMPQLQKTETSKDISGVEVADDIDFPKEEINCADQVLKIQQSQNTALKGIDITETKISFNRQPLEYNDCYEEFEQQHEVVKKAKKNRNPRKKIPDYDLRTQRRIGYAPPDIDQTKIVLKIVNEDEFIEKPVSSIHQNTQEIQLEIPKKDDMYADVDSDIDIESSNKQRLQELQKIKLRTPEKAEINAAEVQDNSTVVEEISSIRTLPETSPTSSLLQMKLRLYKESVSRTPLSDTRNKEVSTSIEEYTKKRKDKTVSKESNDLDSDDDSDELIKELKEEYPAPNPQKVEKNTNNLLFVKKDIHVNPFKNIDPNLSVFVDKLVTPVLMVHTKMNTRIEPTFELRDVHFNSQVRIALTRMYIDRPMTLQTVSWPTILRGYSLSMVSPKGSGKTMGYIPAVCRLVSDFNADECSLGPICIIVCATARSVSEVEMLTRRFLGNTKCKVMACYAGMNELELTTSLLNGCDLLISTPSTLIKLLQSTDFGVDLRRLSTFVLDDCERLSEVYKNEIKYFLLKIKEMLKSRAAKEFKVQYILASRIWCGLMEKLSKRVPNTVICIGAFQECVLYSKANTTATFVLKENKVNVALEFLKHIDNSKKTVIVCRSNEEVKALERALTKSDQSDIKYTVYACDNTMTITELYNLNIAWGKETAFGRILVCCDGNLTHLNVTDAHYLLQYSLPPLYSMFCKRFAVLNDNYASIFNEDSGDVKIKILLEDTNVEQLPKILHFIKRCTNEVPEMLNDVCEKILAEKDFTKATHLVPICDNLLTLGQCPDYWNCQERHAIVKEFDEPKEWVPTNGIITFKILHYHNAVFYSARLLSNIVKGKTTKYPQTYNMLSMKISTYFGKESNRKLQGIPAVGDICAISIQQNHFVRCQVVKILSRYQNGHPNYVLVRLIDEEKLVRSKDVDLFYLPEDLKKPETHVVQVRLANIQPKDKDITFTDLARDHIRNINLDDDLYFRGHIALTIGNCILVSVLETCLDLSSLNKTVVRHDFYHELMPTYAIANRDHQIKLEKLCEDGGLSLTAEEIQEEPEVLESSKVLPEVHWAHLENDSLSPIFLTSVEDPGTFFVRLVKFDEFTNSLHKDIQKHIDQNPSTVTDIKKGDIVLAKLPDDGMYERARVDDVIGENKVKCFFVDNGDWSEIPRVHLAPITETLMTQLPFQAIECRLIGVKPITEEWNDFSINWFTNCFWSKGNLKQLFMKYCTKDKAQYTGGHRYGVALIDTNGDEDVLINELIVDVNLARKEETEIEYIEKTCQELTASNENQSIDDDEWEKISNPEVHDKSNVPLDGIFHKKPIRSVPLVPSDYESDDDEKWQFNITDDFMGMFNSKIENIDSNLPAIAKIANVSDINDTVTPKTHSDEKTLESQSDLDLKNSHALPSPNLLEEIDSDDFTSPEPTLLQKVTEIPNVEKQPTEVDPLRKPKLCWRQNKTSVVIKIQLIGAENYSLKIQERALAFDATIDDTHYGFEIELYGVVDKKKCTHSNKGQYILVNLTKILTKNWLTLTKDAGIRKWIVYDVDSIDTSSDEDEGPANTIANVIKHMNESASESDGDFVDDLNYHY